jgi:uncharacterized protein (TIGR03084 family)
MTMYADLLHDLRAEGDELDSLVSDLAPPGWSQPTPSPGWTVAHQIGHLTWTDERALIAVTAPERFGEVLAEFASAADPLAEVDIAAQQLAAEPPEQLLRRWRAGRQDLIEALAQVPTDTRIVWFGPAMSPASMVSARIMETWAHGQDVADALGVRRIPTARLRHVAHVGVRARDYAYFAHGLNPPAEPFAVELTAPDGERWSWGPPDATQRVNGPALDFCLLVTQRRHRADLAVTAQGPAADQWLDIAQAFAGPPGAGRAPAGSGGAA